jgi:hypothetical protein
LKQWERRQVVDSERLRTDISMRLGPLRAALEHSAILGGRSRFRANGDRCNAAY